MKVATAKQMQVIDALAINNYQIPSVLLMEQAAYQVFLAIEEKTRTKRKKILIICGIGNNGGDGFALARQLNAFSNHDIKVILVGAEDRLSADASIYYNIIKKLDIPYFNALRNKGDVIQQLINEADIIVDGLFGTGLIREITGIFKEIIESINASHSYIVSIDIPSGVSSQDGKILGIAVKADLTITFELPKIGLCIYPGISYVGEMRIVQIGIPKEIIETAPIDIWSIDRSLIQNKLPIRLMRSNKATYGKVLLIGGSRGLSGAITLAASSCMKIGAGLVTAAVPECIHDIMEQKLTEVMTIPLPSQEGMLSVEAINSIKQLVDRYSVIAIGPGLGRRDYMRKILEVVLKTDKPCIIDADALYALKGQLQLLKERKATTVTTPHPGEMSTLTEYAIEEILENTLAIARSFAVEYNVITVIKTERTIIADTNGVTYINTTGNPGMAKGGSGDVLTGIIAGLLAQGLNAIDAAVTGVYLHGSAGDSMVEVKTTYTLMPLDLIEGLEIAIKKININKM